jgi:hypothetical protein
VDNDISSANKELQAKQTLHELSCGGLMDAWFPWFGLLLCCMRGNRNCNTETTTATTAAAAAATTTSAAATTTTTTASAAAAAKAATAATATVARPGSLQWTSLEALGRAHFGP